MHFLHVILASLCLLGCASNQQQGNITERDFDHNVQFQQETLKANLYHLSVISTNKTQFSTLAAFLIRRSLIICQNYGFKIEVLQGVEGFNDGIGLPNLIMKSLSANIECVAK